METLTNILARITKTKTLEDVLAYLDSIETINSGGCGISAYAVYKWLKRNNSLSEDFAIIYRHSWNWEDIETNNNFLQGNSNNATACSHAFFRYNGNYFDSTGQITENVTSDSHVVIEEPNIDRFMDASLQADSWNTRFNRAKYVPLIERKLEINF